MSNGFPDGEFCIVNEDTGLYLASLPGDRVTGSQQETDWLEGAKETVHYSHTGKQVLGLATEPSGKNYERWYFDDRKNSRGLEFYHLVNCAKDIRTAYALAAELNIHGRYDEVTVKGHGQQGQTQWRAEDGYFFPGDPTKAVTLREEQPGRYRVVVADRGGEPRQKWRFV
ncbi:hypothetical protein [Actinomadura oligospora]|uniref:hypothetical protein n=1 Tax=Actinomadura oligospora TaxID=111804 RepID=UPI00047EC02F|nr:hypothetical protein [Actinomadura oligospora]